MSEIIITKENLSKYSRRLQKALSAHFMQEVKLSDAGMLFAKSVGKNNLHELQKVISEEQQPIKNNGLINSCPKDMTSYIVDINQLKLDVKNYFQKEDKNSEISGVFIKDDNHGVSINFDGISNFLVEDIESPYSISMVFNEHPSRYIEDIMSEIKLTTKDKDFIRYLSKNYFLNDDKENVFFGSNLKKIFWCYS